MMRDAPEWITPEIETMIMQSKARWPKAFKLRTVERENDLILHIVKDHFESFNIHEQIKIAEEVNELCRKIQETGCPARIFKV